MDTFLRISKKTLGTVILLLTYIVSAQKNTEIFDVIKKDNIFLPDFSYAGYHFGKEQIAVPQNSTIINALDFGVIPDDGLDDSKALLKTIKKANTLQNPVVIQLPAGRIILSDILYIERSHIILSGQGTGPQGTEIFCPRPMMYLENPEGLKELREYLTDQNKIQKEKVNNINIPFSQYSWSGGFLWARVPGKRVKSYLQKYDTPPTILGTIAKAPRETKTINVQNLRNINVGDVVEIQWFNKKGEQGSLLNELYGEKSPKIGSHHWLYPDLPLARQQVKVIAVTKNTITIASPLLLHIKPEYEVHIVLWEHLEEVGFQHFKVTFPYSNRIAHHVEQGYNAMYLTRLFNSWVKDVVIENADSGILTEAIANVTVEDIVTKGNKKGHYTVQMGGVHNVLVKNLSVQNDVMHPLSFNTFATKSVYTQCEVLKNPILDQHSGVNHQNLFDAISVFVSPDETGTYELFKGGGAGYWKPSHASYNTFWNIDVHFLSQLNDTSAILLNGMKDGPNARVIGVHGNKLIKVMYGPDAYQQFTNNDMTTYPSLYRYQLEKRLANHK
ncbi:hypothetical protein GCM10022393_15120 [Aquimarina addita]|uniref:Pectate lyase superfamily protein domain-containing protein n=1 Tax=Aquimarina addita TaxID=870485 RepID=A0ABP7XFY7_9FLAO